MRTIRAKMLLSLFIAMLVTVGITVLLFVRLIDDILVNQVKSQLHVQALRASRILHEGDIDGLSSTEFRFVVKGLMMNADYLLLDSHNRIIDASDTRQEGKTLHDQVVASEGITTLHGKKVLYNEESVRGLPYRIFVYSPLSSLRALYGSLMRTTLLSIAASFFGILVIGLLTVSRVIRPLNRLKEAVRSYEPNRAQSQDFPEGDRTEIGELITTFHSMSGRIRLHQRNQIEFLQNVSHELKTPLMSIHGFVYAIQDQVVSQEEGLNIITVQSQRLMDMVDKLLQLSRLEAVDEHWPAEALDLRDIAEEAVQLLLPAAAERNVRLELEGTGLQVMIPGEQLFRILLNLLQNAVRHTSSRVKVRIEGPGTGTAWAIHVEDDGSGLNDEEQEAVFQRFYTGSNGVTGLGLAISRGIAARLNGELSYTRSSLGGACFSFLKYEDDFPPSG
ncbi:two-component sensor histidine kinase [Bacillus sp. FJAT-27264]|uniref:sensor histidine kinase n=1 Tax=Paenibacillus sp. (strain DSM 101736 / FJAT-27264) TaxID=1850362 RepID=UPI000807D396|nr:HAMP domain-containing sensor histidine kinase [Bacillus sp. FJAT-27264]OBZ14435.1 two-component sensor histidine kinase [Bacillus sp. FJAT-27264]